MSDQFDLAITDLISTGRTKLQAAAAEKQQREHEQACARQSAIAARSSAAWEELGNLLPDGVLYYAGLCSDISHDDWRDVIYRLEIPNCSAITITLNMTSFTPPVYKPSKNDHYGTERGVYCVSHLGLVRITDDGVEIGYRAGEDGHHSYTDDLSVALAVAAEQGAKMDALSAMAEIKTAEVQSRVTVRQAAADQRQAAAEDSRLSLIAKIIDDDLAVRLVELFLAIQTDRANWESTVQDATEHADSLAERYEHRLADQQRQADLAIRTRQNEVDIAQREADEMQAKLTRLKREAKFA